MRVEFKEEATQAVESISGLRCRARVEPEALLDRTLGLFSEGRKLQQNLM